MRPSHGTKEKITNDDIAEFPHMKHITAALKIHFFEIKSKKLSFSHAGNIKLLNCVDDLELYLVDAGMFYNDKTAMLGVVTTGRPCTQ
jgi:hypothetical protein